MTVELWLGQEYDTAPEMRALRRFLTDMVHRYDQDSDLYLVCANFFCRNEQIDLAVFKRNGVIVIELKEVDGAVVGSENGPWEGTDPDGRKWQLNDRRRRNPYQQVRAYRFAMIDKLKQDALKFLIRNKADQMRLDQVSCVVAFCPTKHKDTKIEISRLPWLSIIGLDELAQEVYDIRSQLIDFNDGELYNLVGLWGFKKADRSKYMLSVTKAGPPTSRTTTSPQTHAEQNQTHAEQIFRTAVRLNREGKSVFARTDVRDRLGIDPEHWKSAYNPTFQGMADNLKPGSGSPPEIRLQKVFHQVSYGKFTLSDHGRQLAQEFEG